jgi:hypothetical protein
LKVVEKYTKLTFGILAVMAFCLQIASKMAGSGGTFGLDDYAMIFAVVCLPFDRRKQNCSQISV